MARLEKYDAVLRIKAMESVRKLVESRIEAQPRSEATAASSNQTSDFCQTPKMHHGSASPAVFNVTNELEKLVIELFELPATDDKIDPIAFYTSGAGKKYGPIAQVALDMFTVSAGEAPCERMFSIAGYFDAARRQFAPRTLSMLTFRSY